MFVLPSLLCLCCRHCTWVQSPLCRLQFLIGLIMAPCGLLWAGAVIHIFVEPLDDIRAMYSCCILLFLLSTYTLATTASLLLHDWLVAPRLRQVDNEEVAWRTHDMMYFTVRMSHTKSFVGSTPPTCSFLMQRRRWRRPAALLAQLLLWKHTLLA